MTTDPRHQHPAAPEQPHEGFEEGQRDLPDDEFEHERITG